MVAVQVFADTHLGGGMVMLGLLCLAACLPFLAYPPTDAHPQASPIAMRLLLCLSSSR
jgi:hypothetical protein